MELRDVTFAIEKQLDKEALDEVISALIKGWGRVCPGEALHVFSIPRKGEEAERKFFCQVHEIMTVYLNGE